MTMAEDVQDSREERFHIQLISLKGDRERIGGSAMTEGAEKAIKWKIQKKEGQCINLLIDVKTDNG